MSSEPAKIAITDIAIADQRLRSVDSKSQKYLDIVDSIKEKGLINAVSVRVNNEVDDKGEPKYEGKPYILIDGGHRFSAFNDLTEAGVEGFDEIPALVLEVQDAALARRLQFIGNNNTRKTAPSEYAEALVWFLAEDPALTHKALAKELNTTPAQISQFLSLNKLTDEVKGMLDNGSLLPSGAIPIARLPKDEQLHYAQKYSKCSKKQRVKVLEQVNARLVKIKEDKKSGRDSDIYEDPRPAARKGSELIALYEACKENPEHPLDLKTLAYVVQQDEESFAIARQEHAERIESKRLSGWAQHLRGIVKKAGKGDELKKGMKYPEIIAILEEADPNAAASVKSKVEAGESVPKKLKKQE